MKTRTRKTIYDLTDLRTSAKSYSNYDYVPYLVHALQTLIDAVETAYFGTSCHVCGSSRNEHAAECPGARFTHQPADAPVSQS